MDKFLHESSSEKRTALLRGDVLTQELSHEVGDLVAVFLQGEVAGVEQVELEGLQVLLYGSAPAGGKIVSFLPHTMRVGGWCRRK